MISAFLFLRLSEWEYAHSCLNKNNFVMISICEENRREEKKNNIYQLKSHQSNGTMKSHGFQTQLERKTYQFGRQRIQWQNNQPTNWAAYSLLVFCSFFSACVLFQSRTLQNQLYFMCMKVSLSLTEKNIYMLNYDLTLLFKQFILMLVAVLVQSYSLAYTLFSFLALSHCWGVRCFFFSFSSSIWFCFQ